LALKKVIMYNNPMIKILKAILIKKIQFLSIFISPNPRKITFIRKYYSGSNVTPVYEKMRNNKKGIEVELIHNHPDDMNIFNQTELYFKLLKSKIIVTTHGVSFKTKKNITVDLWHGIALKGMNLMDNLEKKPIPQKNIDYISSYSTMVNTLFNACFGMKARNYKILGSPRNDYLFEKKDEKKHRQILRCERGEKIIFYMPTFREYIKENYETFISNLAFENFDIEKFNEFLKENNLKFILKPHPNDNNIWKNIFSKKLLSNFFLLTEEILFKNKVELYELLATSSMLITDYSSVYIDYLLTDNPIIFIPTDLEKYSKGRNMLLEPYDVWTPGSKCFNQEELQTEIKKNIEDKNYYMKERATMRKIFHKYSDNKSTERTIKFLENLIN